MTYDIELPPVPHPPSCKKHVLKKGGEDEGQTESEMEDSKRRRGVISSGGLSKVVNSCFSLRINQVRVFCGLFIFHFFQFLFIIFVRVVPALVTTHTQHATGPPDRGNQQ